MNKSIILTVLIISSLLLLGCSSKKEWIHPSKHTKEQYNKDRKYCYDNYKKYLGKTSAYASTYTKPDNSDLGKAQNLSSMVARSNLEIGFGSAKCMYSKGWKHEEIKK